MENKRRGSITALDDFLAEQDQKREEMSQPTSWGDTVFRAVLLVMFMSAGIIAVVVGMGVALVVGGLTAIGAGAGYAFRRLRRGKRIHGKGI